MDSGCEFKVGQLIEYRTWYDGEGSWISIEQKPGIVLEIIIISDPIGIYSDGDTKLYDIKVYWITEQRIETVPDLLLCPYGLPLEFK